MRKISVKTLSVLIPFAAFLVGGSFSIYRTFLVETSPLSFTNPLWLFVVMGYFLVQAALAAHQFFNTQGSSKTIPLPTWWMRSRGLQFIATASTLLVLGFSLCASPIDRLIVHTLNSFWLNFPLALFTILIIKTLQKNGSAGPITSFDLINAGILYVTLFIASPLFVFYPTVNASIILATAALIAIAYIDLPIPAKVIESLGSARFKFFAALCLLLVSAGVFLYFSVNGLITTTSIMDEGSYSIKGYLFATGQYFPFQDYGPWTNKMPLAFMIPGWIQATFGPSLFAIRIAAVIMQAITGICLFIIGKRYLGFFGGALAFALFAFNPAFPSFYSQGNTQVISIFLVSLVLVFTLGKERGVISLLIGNLFAGLLLLARENMAPFVVFLNFYLFWEHGWRKAIVPIASGWLVFGVGHIYYWPGILKVWAKWMPKELTPILDEFRNKGGGKLMWKREGRNTDLITSLGSFAQGISSNIVNMLAVFVLPLLVKIKRTTIANPLFKATVFLWVSTIFLTFIHAFITLDDGSCVYCFSSYLSFFTPVAIALFVVTLGLLSENSSKVAKAGVFLLSGFLFTIEWYNHRQDLRWLTQIRLTSILNESGFQFLSDLLESNFKVDYEVSKSLVPALFGLGLFILLLVFGYWIWVKWYSPRNQVIGGKSLALLTVSILMASNLLLIPSSSNECRSDIPKAYSKATASIRTLIPEGKKIFWLGESTAILLGLPNAFYPQQFNEGFGYKVGSIDELAERYGFWNPNLARKWSEETDYMIIEENKMENPILDNVDFSNFVEVARTPRVNGCDKSSFYHIYERVR